MSVPIDNQALSNIASTGQRLVLAQYTDFWRMESDSVDGISPLAALSTVLDEAHFGTAILPVQTRGPGLLAMTVAGLASLAPGRVTVGLGASSPTIMAKWNCREYGKPVSYVESTLRFLRKALEGEQIDEDFGSFSVRGFRLTHIPQIFPQFAVAALRCRMLALAPSVGSAITNWLSPEDVFTIRREIGSDTRLIARLIVCQEEVADQARTLARRLIAGYQTVPA